MKDNKCRILKCKFCGKDVTLPGRVAFDNGELLGCCEECYELFRKFRKGVKIRNGRPESIDTENK